MKITRTKVLAFTAAAGIAFACAQIFAAPKAKNTKEQKTGPKVDYISPNNDGVQDELSKPLKSKIKNNAKTVKSFISEWRFEILDEKKNVVRTILNKTNFVELTSAKALVKALGQVKKDVAIPETIVWNGYLDDGSVAPDGKYTYRIWTMKSNGASDYSPEGNVIVDNTPPSVKIKELSSSDKMFGEGDKAVLPLEQSGSVEEVWTAKITDTSGKIIRTYRWEKAAPDKIVWNGTDDNNAIVPDGVYSYEITSTDLAGNVCEKTIVPNIIFSAEKPETSIAISGSSVDSRYFSPNPKGEVARERKNVSFDVSIPSPKASVNSLVAWKIDVVGKNDDNVLFSLSAENAKAPEKFVFDGKDSNGNYLEEGEYRAKVTARYLNGYEPKAVYSPVFVLDNEAPKAAVTLPQNTIFNGQSMFEISQQAVSENSFTGPKNWTGKIVDSEGNIAKTYEFGSMLPSVVEWNGLNEDDQFKDSTYTYVLEVTELAGNKRTISSAEFTLDTSKTELAVSVAPKAFSLHSESSQKKVTITPVVNASSGISQYEIAVCSNGNTVRTFRGNGKVPSSIAWDGLSDSGTRCDDGEYSVRITTTANSGTEASADSGKFILDSTPPVVKVSVPYAIFSPEETSTKQILPVAVEESSVEDLWTAEIKNSANATVKTLNWENAKAGSFDWDGTDDNGNKVANGIYSLVVYAKDAAGNKGSATIAGINLDARPVAAYVTAELKGISPNGDSAFDSQKFDIKITLTEGISSWKFDIVDENGSVAKQFSEKDQKDVPAVINWAGDTDGGTVAEGIFKGKLHVEYAKGNVVDTETSSFICTTLPPDLNVRTAPAYFSPDNDGNDDDLFIQLKCKSVAGLKNWSFTIYNPIKDETKPLSPFWKSSGKNVMTERLVWDGRGNNGEIVQSAEDYPYVLEAYDELGMHSTFKGVINVDVLIIRDGDKLKMQIPSIIFRANAADFDYTKPNAKITEAQAANNQRILKRVAEILNKFKDYKVTVVGHANRITDKESEETEELIPLSTQRAEYVKNQLIALKVKNGEKRLSSEGKGGTEPVADRKNSEVNWKNRRVEFILQK